MEFAIILTICFVVLFGCYLTLVNLIPHLKNKKREKIERTQKEMVFNKRKALEKTIKDKISDVDFGSLGKISKENIDIDFLLDKVDFNSDYSTQIDSIIAKCNDWKVIIEKNNQYIINYFMDMVLIETDYSNNPFWENYLTDETKYNNEKCLEIFRKTYTKQFEKEIDKYCTKQDTKDIGQLFKKHFKFFDYDKFIQNIKVILFLDDDKFCIDMTDKYESCLCGAYEEFDENLKGYEWHNF